MGIWEDFFRGSRAVSDQRKFNKHVRNITRALERGEDHDERDENGALAAARRLGIRPERRGK